MTLKSSSESSAPSASPAQGLTPKTMTLKMGSRRSLLARAQSMAFARTLEERHPHVQVEFVGIETRGDIVLDRPLSAMDGKEFFVAELDDALRSMAVDFTVHSLKDLSLERPVDFELAAFPLRSFANDVLIIGPHTVRRLNHSSKSEKDSIARLRIGTSSPRRLENIPALLSSVIPELGERKIDFVEIRGNVNTRLARVQIDPLATDSDQRERALDGVVLAFAGLERLAQDQDAVKELAPLLKGTQVLILPLRQNPTAPGQGALAVECRKPQSARDHDVRTILKSLHDPATDAAVRSERAVLAEWGGGCHQRFGATQIHRPGLEPLLWIKGAKSDSTIVDEVRWKRDSDSTTNRTPTVGRAWDGSAHRITEPCALDVDETSLRKIATAKTIFVGHERAVTLSESVLGAVLHAQKTHGARIWTAGFSSAAQLVARGLWVQGSAEALGFEYARDLMDSVLLRTAANRGPSEQDLCVILTHDRAHEFETTRAPQTESISTYTLAPLEPSDPRHARALAALAQATHLYWSSASQFEALARFTQPKVHHACGPGKTAHYLRSNGIEPEIFPGPTEWRKSLPSGVTL